jgi:mannose-6-phosphate isomerase-like protein (cupin superfamily)
MSTDVELITAGEKTLCYVIRRTLAPAQTIFITPSDAKQQVGFIVYPQGGVIKRHAHRSLERRLVGMSEVLVLRSGRCEMDIYDDQHALVATRDLQAGDVIVLVGGGHGFRMLEDTVFLEIKQGPYLGAADKELF